jgi:photosystem II stability/assembly factor-like uncharacterized protein
MKARRFSLFLMLILCVSMISQSSSAQEIFGHGSETTNPTVDPVLLQELEYRNIGPFRGGRSVAVAGHDSNPYVFYTGFAGGGVYKTMDGGNSWYNITDKYFKTGSVGAITVAPSDPNVIYVGMGETDIRGNMSPGDGMYKSTDAGKTWEHIGLGQSAFIGDIEVHPYNPDIVWVAAMGQLFGTEGNDKRGVYMSMDGGKSWERVLYVNEMTGAVDIGVDPNNPRILFAAMWRAYRSPWEMSSGGEGSGLYQSKDGGKTWTNISTRPGLPKGKLGKIGVNVSPVNSEIVYAMIENENGGLFKSTDGGESWRRINKERKLRQRAWYYTKVIPDTKNEDIVYVLNVQFHKSTDGGRTFSSIGTPHGDHHDLWISPSDPGRMIIGDDGGGQVTYNGGESWSSYYTSATAQIYQVFADNQFPYMIYGAQQDNSTFAIRSRTGGGSIGERDWWPVAGGESGYIAPDPENPDVTFGGSYGGYLNKYNAETGMSDRIDVWPDNPMGSGADVLKYRFQWTFPIVISPHDPDVLYATSQHVHRSTDEGMSWEEISGDLTRNDKSKQGESGGPITKDDTSVEYYNTIFTFVESPIEAGLLWAGSDDGLIHISKDNGETWENVTPKGMPETMVSILDASHHDPGTAYFAATRYKFGDFQPMIYKTSNYGKSWKRINNGIPATDFTRVVREDPNKKGLLYAGTETGMYVSFNDGENWQPLQLNLPPVPITDLALQKEHKDLIVATQGRSFWVLDDLQALHQISDDLMNKKAELLEPEDTYLYGRSFNIPAGATAGQNPTSGIVVYYTLNADQEEELKLQFSDWNDEVIQTFSSKTDPRGRPVKESTEFYEEEEQQRNGVPTAHAGLNRFVWNLRYPDVTRINGTQILWAGGTGGQQAPPGTYHVSLWIGDEMIAKKEVEVLKDPRLTDVTQDDIMAQFNLVRDIKAKLDTTHKAINKIREVRSEITEALAESGDNEEAKNLAKEIRKALTEIEEALVQTKAESIQDVLNFPIRLNNKLAALSSTVETGLGRPTQQQYAVFADLSAKVDAQLERLKPILEGQFTQFIEEIENPAIPINNDER